MWLSWHVGKGKLNQILQRDWLSERATLGYPARSGFPTVSRKKMVFFLPHESKLVWSRWLDIEIELLLNILNIDLEKETLTNNQPS